MHETNIRAHVSYDFHQYLFYMMSWLLLFDLVLPNFSLSSWWFAFVVRKITSNIKCSIRVAFVGTTIAGYDIVFRAVKLTCTTFCCWVVEDARVCVYIVCERVRGIPSPHRTRVTTCEQRADTLSSFLWKICISIMICTTLHTWNTSLGRLWQRIYMC